MSMPYTEIFFFVYLSFTRKIIFLWESLFFFKLINIANKYLRISQRVLMKRNFKQRWSTIPPMSTKRTIAFHLNSLKTKMNMTNDVGHQGRSLGQAQKCGGVKLVNAIPTLPLLITVSTTTIHI